MRLEFQRVGCSNWSKGAEDRSRAKIKYLEDKERVEDGKDVKERGNEVRIKDT